MGSIVVKEQTRVIIFLVFLLGLVAGAGGLSLLAYIKVPKNIVVQEKPTRTLDPVHHPVKSRYHGGSAEQVIVLPHKDYRERLAAEIAWEAEAAGFEGMDFFTYDLTDPTRVIVGRRYKVSDWVGNQIVVATDGLHAQLMPPTQAIEFLNEKIREAEQEALRQKKPWNKRFEPTEIDQSLTVLMDTRKELESNIAVKMGRGNSLPQQWVN